MAGERSVRGVQLVKVECRCALQATEDSKCVKTTLGVLLNGIPTGESSNVCRHHWHGVLVCSGSSDCMGATRCESDSLDACAVIAVNSTAES